MAQNMFINTTGLEIEKQVPALVGIDFSGFKKTGMEVNVGDVISSLANKGKKIKDKQNFVRLKNALDQEEAQYKSQYLSDPNAFVNEENRKQMVDAYNSLVERKKQLISSAKGTMSADQYSQIEDYFKEQTYSSLYNTQYNINVGYIKQTTDDVILESNNILEQLTSIDDPSLRDNRIKDALDLMNGLKEFGVDPREMQLQYLVNAQKKMTDYEVNTKIINSTAEKYWMRDKNGNVIKDSNGNPYIDNAKKNTDLLNLGKTFLSEDQINASANEMVKAIDVDFEVAKSYIKNNREGDWLRIAQDARSKFAAQDDATNAKIVAEERKINEAGYTNQEKVREKVDKDWKEMGGLVFGKVVNDNDLFEPSVMKTLTDDKYYRPEDLYNNGYYIRTINDSELNNLEETKNNKDYASLSEQLKILVGSKEGDTSKDTLTSFKLQQIGDSLNLKPNTIDALAGKSNVVTSEEAQAFMLADTNIADVDVTRLEYSDYLRSTGIDMNLDGEAFQLASKMLLTSQDKVIANFRNQAVAEVYNRERSLVLMFKEAESDPTLRAKIDSVINKAKYLVGGTKKIAYSYNTGNSSLMRQAYQAGVSSETMKRAATLDKEGVLPQAMLPTQAGSNEYNLPKGTADYKLESLKNKTYSVTDLQLMDWDNEYFRQSAVPYVIRDLDSGELDALKVPSKILKIPEIENYYKKKLEE